jgi:hypothetical protein
LTNSGSGTGPTGDRDCGVATGFRRICSDAGTSIFPPLIQRKGIERRIKPFYIVQPLLTIAMERLPQFLEIESRCDREREDLYEEYKPLFRSALWG